MTDFFPLQKICPSDTEPIIAITALKGTLVIRSSFLAWQSKIGIDFYSKTPEYDFNQKLLTKSPIAKSTSEKSSFK